MNECAHFFTSGQAIGGCVGKPFCVIIDATRPADQLLQFLRCRRSVQAHEFVGEADIIIAYPIDRRLSKRHNYVGAGQIGYDPARICLGATVVVSLVQMDGRTAFAHIVAIACGFVFCRCPVAECVGINQACVCVNSGLSLFVLYFNCTVRVYCKTIFLDITLPCY